MSGHRMCPKCGRDDLRHEDADAHVAACNGDVEALEVAQNEIEARVSELETTVEDLRSQLVTLRMEFKRVADSYRNRFGLL